MYLIDACNGVSANYDSIRDLFEEVKDFTSRLTVHTRQNVPDELREIVTEILVCLLNVCAQSVKLIGHGRVGQLFKRVFLGKDEQISAELNKLRNLTQKEQRMVATLTLLVTTNTAAQKETLQQFRTEVLDRFSSLNSGIMSPIEDLQTPRLDIRERQLNKIRAVLRPSSTPEEIYRTITSKRVPGTGDWIRENPIFRSWLEREKPILWLSGRPGAGKSFLSTNIIQYLMQLHPQGSRDTAKVSIAYYFCKDVRIAENSVLFNFSANLSFSMIQT
jgi:hypothetical protein